MAKKYLLIEVKVDKNKISVYKETRIIRPSSFYTAAETRDPMKIGNMKVPDDPFGPKSNFNPHKAGTSSFKKQMIINGKKCLLNVQRNCTHSRTPLYRGSDRGDYGIAVTTNSRGRTTATRDYYPDHLFKHQERLTFSWDEMAQAAGMSKVDLVVYLIENGKRLIENGSSCLELESNIDHDGFIYCAFNAFELNKYKDYFDQKVAERRAEEARRQAVLEANRQEELRQKEMAYRQGLGSDKMASLEKAEEEGVKLVDLGLSVRWADRNVGAKSPGDVGNFYAWGEVNPKTEFTTKNYQPEIKVKRGDFLDAKSDPATVRWGTGWHVPSKEQWEELFNKCHIREVEDHSGVVFTGPNGNSIFIAFINAPHPLEQQPKKKESALGKYLKTQVIGLKESNTQEEIVDFSDFVYLWTNYCNEKKHAQAVSIRRGKYQISVSRKGKDKGFYNTKNELISFLMHYGFPVRAVME